MPRHLTDADVQAIIAKVKGRVSSGDIGGKAGAGITAHDAVARFGQASRGFRFGAAVVEYAEILAHSQHSEGAEFGRVIAIAEGALGQQEEEREFVELVRAAQRLSR